MVLTQSQKQDIKSVISEIYDDEWISKLITKITKVIREEFKIRSDEQDRVINKLKEDLNKETQKNLKNEQNIDNLEQYGRRQNLRIFGIEEKKGENTENILLNLFNDKLNVNLSPEMIERSHRIGAPKENKKRAIIVKFQSYKHKQLVFQNKRKLKNTNISIMEDLTSLRQELYRESCKQIDKKKIWTSDGNIFTYINEKIQIIRKPKDIEDILNEHNQ